MFPAGVWPRPHVYAARAVDAVRAFVVRHWGLLFALCVTAGVYAPGLRYFFDGDDFVVLGSVEYLGARRYIADTFFMRDIVPNWRPLTGAVYAVEWQLWGLNPSAWRALNLSVHLGSAVLLYALMLRVTARPPIGALAALIFGVSGAHSYTVTYVTALPHILATFFVLASLLTMVAYTQDRERNPAPYAGAVLFFALAFLANEGAFVFAPVLAGAYALFGQRWRQRPAWRGAARLVLHVAPFAALASGWLSFYESCTCQQLKFDDYYWGEHVVRNYGVYLSWIAYPSGSVPLEPTTARWIIAGALAGALLLAAILGPHIVRLAALGVVLALLPFVPVEIWTASRYTYAAVSFFAPIAAVAAYRAFDIARNAHRWARWPAIVASLAAVATVASLYGWQTTAQDGVAGRNNERWSVLAQELRRNYAEVPDGTTIYILDGLWSNPGWQYTWVPSVARAGYGDAAAFELSRADLAKEPPDGRRSLFLQWDGQRLQPLPADLVARWLMAAKAAGF
jgi:hypothetical protein